MNLKQGRWWGFLWFLEKVISKFIKIIKMLNRQNLISVLYQCKDIRCIFFIKIRLITIMKIETVNLIKACIMSLNRTRQYKLWFLSPRVFCLLSQPLGERVVVPSSLVPLRTPKWDSEWFKIISKFFVYNCFICKNN